jgi:hypothetical protein
LDAVPPALVEKSRQQKATEVHNTMLQESSPSSLLSVEDFWDELLPNIEKRRVIPIVGPDLLQLEIEGQSMLLDRYLAGQLRQHFSEAAGLPIDASLSSVVGHLLQRHVRTAKIYPAVNDILVRCKFQPPRALVQLAEITHFNLFVTTDIHCLLEDAINAVSFAGANGTESIAYRPSDAKDLNYDYPGQHRKQDWPTVYHLLGRCSKFPDEYVISEADLLEFVCALQSDRSDRQPKKLFDALRFSYLLFLGGNYPDWLARFFLRTARQNRLSHHRQVGNQELLEIVADSRSSADENLVVFLKHFSTSTRVVFRRGGPVEFVDELWRRWGQANPHPPARSWAPPPEQIPENAVFLSYASEDRPAVQRLKEGLENDDLPVWFDQSHLMTGDDWDHKIRTNIHKCSCFEVVLSRNARDSDDRYFRKEWTWAIDRAAGMAPNRKFLVPVVIDDTKDFGDALPVQLQDKQWASLPAGQVTPDFLQSIRKIVTEHQKRKS